MLVGVLVLSVSGGAAAERARVEPNSLYGRRLSPLKVPATADGYVAVASTPSGDGAWFLETDGTVTGSGDAIGHGDAPTDAPFEPAADIAAASNRGYWVVTNRGRVTALGDAARFGSQRMRFRTRNIVAMAARPEGDGYWLVSNDGIVYAFGRATSFGDAHRARRSDVIDISTTDTGNGYFLVTRNGSVFAYGDALEQGEPAGFIGPDVVGIASDPDDTGYWIALDTGAVLAYRAGNNRAGFAPAAAIETVAIASRPGRGFWTLQGERLVDHLHPFLVCTRSHESSHTPPFYDDGYRAISPSGQYRGAYQFSRSTWDSTARHANRSNLVGLDPASASVVDQDLMATHLYGWQGADPWMGRCAGL